MTATATTYRTTSTSTGTAATADPEPAGTAPHGWMGRAWFTLRNRSQHDLVGRRRALEATQRLTLDVPTMRF
ncbi:MAG: hypothetical protein QOE01_521 [Actinomycetota bacterium]|jgi:hypothetical protein|nr:hypothetical protein [Actinomycetota bacterium]